VLGVRPMTRVGRRAVSGSRLKQVRVILVAILLVGGLAGCGGGDERGSGGSVIKLAAPIDLSGPSGSFGGSYKNALEFAVNKINDEGGIKALGGAKLELLVADSKGDPQQTVQLFRQMNAQGAKVAVGPIDSTSAIAVKPTLISLDMVLVTATSDASLLKDNDQAFYRWSTTAERMTELAFDFIKNAVDAGDIHVSSVGTISQSIPVGPTINTAVKDYAKKEGWDVTALTYDPQQTQDFAPLIAKLRNADVDLVVGYNLGGASIAIEKAIAAQSWRPKNGFVWSAGGPANLANFQEQVGAVVTNQMTWSFGGIDTKCDAVSVLNDEFKKQHRRNLTATDLGAISAIEILRSAVEQAGSTKKDDLAKVLHSGKPIAKFCHGLYVLPGEALFSDGGNNDGLAGVVLQFDGKGGSTVVWPEAAAKGDATWPASDQ